MHIPDGYISPSTAAAAFAAVAPFWVIAGRRVRKSLKAAAVPRLGVFAALSFVLMMFNIPLAGGTSGHAVGGALMALALGPWEAVLGVSTALAIQAFFFGDGGLQALGANCLNLGVILPFVAWLTFRALRRGGLCGVWAAGLAGWFGLMGAALAVAVELGIQPMLFHTASGAPLYNPYGLKTALGVMIPSHAFVAAPVEGLVTGLVWGYLMRTQPGLLAKSDRAPGRYQLWPAWATLFLLALLTPVGLLTKGPAWGEWGSDQLRAALGYVPAGLAHAEGRRLPALFADYTVFGMNGHAAYIVSAVLGISLVAATVWSLLRLARAGAPAPIGEESADTL